MGSQTISCDSQRIECLETLDWAGPSTDSILAIGKYFSKVDDRSRTNNYRDLIKDALGHAESLSNSKTWIAIHPLSDMDKLVDQLGFKWPTKSTSHQRRQVEQIFNDIDDEFQRKGLKPAPRLPPQQQTPQGSNKTNDLNSRKQCAASNDLEDEYDPILSDERLKNIDKNIGQRILNEVVHQKQDTKWDDIAGLENVKQAINEIVVYPMQNPELFQGLLAPAKGLLLFGPPGTGKTLIGKCIAAESGATFFAISASSLTSKWVGEGEKMVRALFAVARCLQPSVVFIDEIDSLLTQRVDGEHDSSRRMKTEFLVQFDGVSTGTDDRLLIVGATNRPQELDEAARRRFTKRLYVPLPDEGAREQIIETLMKKAKSALTDDCIRYIVEKTDGFSGADMSTLCKEAALSSVRAVIRQRGNAKNLASGDIPPVVKTDFEQALKHVKASVSGNDLGLYEEWDTKYGASRETSTQGS